jgi:hypothetical protein
MSLGYDGFSRGNCEIDSLFPPKFKDSVTRYNKIDM